MNKNNEIIALFSNLSNDDLRFNKDITSEYYIHDNQINSAKQIILSWLLNNDDNNNRHSILLAKMQSGKTGVFMSLIYILTKYDNIRNYFGIEKFSILTGMNDTGLEQQLIDRIVNQTGINKDVAKDIVLKNSEMKQIISIGENISIDNRLIIVDESHFGNTKDNNVLPTFLIQHGIDQQNSPKLKEKNVYFVSVSATPFDEFNSDLANSKSLIELKNTPLYYGISEFFNLGLIKPNKKLNNSTLNWFDEQINIQLKRMADDNCTGAIIVRTTNKDIIKYLNNNVNLTVNEFHGKEIDYDKFNKQYLGQFEYPKEHTYYPKKPLVILIKGTFRAGVSIDSIVKKHIYAVFDSNDSQTHTTAQGLIGRLCGYYSSKIEPKTHFYINNQAAEEYAEWESNNFSADYLPTNNTYKTYLVDEKINDEYVISGKHYKTFEVIINDYNDYLDNKKNIFNIIKKYANNELIDILNKISQDDIHEKYLFQNNVLYGDSVLKKYIKPITDSMYETINLSPRTKNISENNIGKYYIHVIEDSNILNKLNNTNFSINDLLKTNKLIVYIGKYCYKHRIYEKGKNVRKVIDFLNTDK